MTLSYSWLQDYIPSDLSSEKVSEILTAVGLEVEHVEKTEQIPGSLNGIVIGKILTCQKHPNADKLSVTTVDIGNNEIHQIVCGAPNVDAGQTVLVAQVGATLYPKNGEPFEIKKAKIRGEESFGMICAEDEIGIGESHDGILILDNKWEAGTAAKTYFNLPEGEITFEIGLTPNRMDAMSHRGSAKDICAYLSNLEHKIIALKMPKYQLPEKKADLPFSISIENNEACNRYCGISIANVNVAPSPDWLKQKLNSIGVKSINNLVDISNYLLHDSGQPLHIFDYDKIKNQKINIKTSVAQAEFKTLDNEKIKTHPNDIFICDDEQAMCLAGVYGGLESGVSSTTKNIFIESASFNSIATRQSMLRHNLRTDAAVRFEKGIDISQVKISIERAAALIIEICGGEIASEIVDVYPKIIESKTLSVSLKKINALAGKNFSAEQIKLILTALCFEIISENEDELTLKIPLAKPDIDFLADIVEEITRIDGLDNIPFTGKINFSLNNASNTSTNKEKNDVAKKMVSLGFNEILTNAISNAENFNDRNDVVKMLNSLTVDLNAMRATMTPSGLQAIAHNINRRNSDLLFFEFGKTYHQENGKYNEVEKLSLFLTGNFAAENWLSKKNKIDFYYCKGLLNILLPNKKIELLKDENQFSIVVNKNKIGSLILLTPKEIEKFGIKQEVFCIDLNWLDVIKILDNKKVSFKEISKFPIVSRDLSLVLDKSILFADVEKMIKKSSSALLKSISVFDVFESEKLGDNKKAYAVSFTFQDEEKTLTDNVIENEMQQIMSSLEKQLQAEVRGK
ncbi:MAG: phenylalanine--tRNA ligase subunit beta [Chitinophagaceae bacterium]|nr:phenylalanine--tRNA ligase subunit beta [Chitinophagaceae bacterium]